MKSEEREAREQYLGAQGSDYRPAIPAELVRRLLFEAGHRCAVCGTECPLERAHIIPWRQRREHTIENLICLCANCHARADLEKWTSETLRSYKEKPWVLRHRELQEAVIEEKVRVKLTIKMDLEAFDEKYQRFLQYAVASFLEISHEDVKIKRIERGSVIITFEVPRSSTEKFAQKSGITAAMRIIKSLGVERIEVLDENGHLLISSLGPEEEALIGIWRELLNIDNVGPSDDFFDLGGHSLLATQLMARIREIFGVELHLRSVFQAPTVTGMAELIREARIAGEVTADEEDSRPDGGESTTMSLHSNREVGPKGAKTANPVGRADD